MTPCPFPSLATRPHTVNRFLNHARDLGQFSDGIYNLYFPPGLVPGDRLIFKGYDGTRTWVQAVGVRNFRIGQTEREPCRYHLSPTVRPTLWKYGEPVLQVQMHLYLTDRSGRPVRGKKIQRRRKRICRDWWNYEWLGRLLGFVQWMTDGQDSINLGRAPACRIVLSGEPLTLQVPAGIDESLLETIVYDEEADLDDLGEPDEAEDEIDE